MTELFFNREDIYVDDDDDDDDDDDVQWLWGQDAIMRYAWSQRGYVAYDHLRWERSCACLPRPKGSPVSYWPIMVVTKKHVERGGMPTHLPEDNPMRCIADPKKAMMHWAQHKLQTDTPSIVGPTFTMPLKAEARTIPALMNSKSPMQTKQIMVAAYRRAGLQDPFLPYSNLENRNHQPFLTNL